MSDSGSDQIDDDTTNEKEIGEIQKNIEGHSSKNNKAFKATFKE